MMRKRRSKKRRRRRMKRRRKMNQGRRMKGRRRSTAGERDWGENENAGDPPGCSRSFPVAIETFFILLPLSLSLASLALLPSSSSSSASSSSPFLCCLSVLALTRTHSSPLLPPPFSLSLSRSTPVAAPHPPPSTPPQFRSAALPLITMYSSLANKKR